MTTTLLTALAFIQQTATQGQRAEVQEMTAGGWAFMISAWVFILVLVYYTFEKVLRGGK